METSNIDHVHDHYGIVIPNYLWIRLDMCVLCRYVLSLTWDVYYVELLYISDYKILIVTWFISNFFRNIVQCDQHFPWVVINWIMCTDWIHTNSSVCFLSFIFLSYYKDLRNAFVSCTDTNIKECRNAIDHALI